MNQEIQNFMTNQKEIFLSTEGDAYAIRNEIASRSLHNYPDIDLISKYMPIDNENKPKILEIGCGLGNRTFELAKQIPSYCFGIDPSKVAIEKAKKFTYEHNNDANVQIEFKVGTADSLEFPDKYFDLVYFGFLLYLVDRDLLPRVYQETCRVLKSNGFVAILDFFVSSPTSNIYKHDLRIRSFKDKYDSLFEELGFTRIAQLSLNQKGSIGFEIDPDERTAFTLLKRV